MFAASDRKWVLTFALFLMVITTIPYLIGFMLQGEDWRFTGFVFGVEDGNSYIAKMLKGARGDWLFTTPYTAYPQKGVLAFLPYLLLGKLTHPPAQHDQLVALFQIFRWAGLILAVFATYDFITLFIREKRFRRIALVLATVGGGLGWLSLIGFSELWGDRIPLEFYSPDTFGFLSLFGLPHLAVARALLLWGLVIVIKNPSPKSGLICGLLWLLMGFMQPITIVSGWAVLFVYLCLSIIIHFYLTRKRHQTFSMTEITDKIKTCAIVVLLSSPIVLYTAFSFSTDAYLTQWTKQNLILSPPVGDYLLAYSPMLFLVVYGLIIKKEAWQEKHVFLLGWIILLPLLAYAPVNIQRRLPDGLWVAMVILGLLGVEKMEPFSRRIINSILFLGILPALALLVASINGLSSPNVPLYRPNYEVNAYLFLDDFLHKGDVVVATYDRSNALPAWAPAQTVIGHGPESVNLPENMEWVDALMSGNNIRSVVTLLADFNVRFILLCENERSDAAPLLTEFSTAMVIYQNSGCDLWEIQQP